MLPPSPIWTPLWWHRKLLEHYIAAEGAMVLSQAAQVFPGKPLRVLDMGCGSMPYRTHFSPPNIPVHYFGADVETANDEPDYAITVQDQRVAVQDAAFELVVSFQVLEHVPDYRAFLRECFRALVPGGFLFLTAPFAFEFHGVPCDYRRWTHEGLRHDLAEIKFSNIKVAPVESDAISILTITELWIASRWGYFFTKPLFLALNIFGLLGYRGPRGGIPLTNGVVCQKPFRQETTNVSACGRKAVRVPTPAGRPESGSSSPEPAALLELLERHSSKDEIASAHRRILQVLPERRGN